MLYAVTPEIYPTRLRGAASGAAAACGRVAAIIAPLLMPWFLTLSGGNKAVAFIVFAVAFILACVAACACLNALARSLRIKVRAPLRVIDGGPVGMI